MRYILALLLLLCPIPTLAQDLNHKTNSLFDDSDAKAFPLKNIMVQGEVEEPGIVDIRSLPLRSSALKEVALENGKQVFKGAYFVSGYALYDILSGKKIKKAWA